MMALPYFQRIKTYECYSVVITYCKKCYCRRCVDEYICNDEYICIVCGEKMANKLITNPNDISIMEKKHIRYKKLKRILYE